VSLKARSVDGLPPSGLRDSAGRLIGGDHDGTPGGNAVAVLSRGGVTVDATTPGTTGSRSVGIPAIVDALFDRDELVGVDRASGPTGPLKPPYSRPASTAVELIPNARRLTPAGGR
jgi:hypothetical protein